MSSTVPGHNPYDMRIKCEKPPLCYDFGSVETFLNATWMYTLGFGLGFRDWGFGVWGFGV